MSNRKKLILALALITGILCCLGSSEFNLRYMYAESRYADENEIDGKILFSKKSGFYDENFFLNIYAPTDEIYYTLDGSEPTKDSLKYEEPILIYDASINENTNSMREDYSGQFLLENGMYHAPNYLIDKCTVLRAVYYDQYGNRSKTEEQIYFVGYQLKSGYQDVNIISITAEPEGLFSDETGILVLGDTFEEYKKVVPNYLEKADYSWEGNFHNRGFEWERVASAQVFNTDKELVLSQVVGLRIQGGVSRAYYPNSLNLFARDEYSGSNELGYDFFDTGYYPQRVTLASGGNDYRGKMKDRLGAELSKDLNFSTMNYEPYVLFLNGEYWGFFYLAEKFDENYIEHYYGINKDNVVIFKNSILEVGLPEDQPVYSEMRDFISNADMTDEENYQKACELIDMQSFIDYYAAEIYMARNGDWPHGNYALWRSRGVSEKPYEDGKWRWMLFDVNTSAFMDYLSEHDTIAYAKENCPLFANLCNNEQFRKDFADKLREMRDAYFAEDLVNAKLDEYKALMSEPMEKHYQRFFGMSNDKFNETRSGMRGFAYSRQAYIETMLLQNGFK